MLLFEWIYYWLDRSRSGVEREVWVNIFRPQWQSELESPEIRRLCSPGNHTPNFSTMRPAVLEMWKWDAHAQMCSTHDLCKTPECTLLNPNHTSIWMAIGWTIPEWQFREPYWFLTLFRWHIIQAATPPPYMIQVWIQTMPFEWTHPSVNTAWKLYAKYCVFENRHLPINARISPLNKNSRHASHPVRM